MKIKLVEGKLTKQKVDELTKKWFEIKENQNMSDVDKRTKFDELYDEATEKVFDVIGNVKGYNGVKNYMHTAWLKLGFEAGDGNNPAIELSKELVGASGVAPAEKIIPFIIENYNSVGEYINGLGNFSETFKKDFLATRTDLWTKYSAEDIRNIIVSIYKLLKSKRSTSEKQNELERIKKVENLRDLITDASKTKKDKTVKVNKVTSKTSDKAAKQILKNVGYDLDKTEDKQRLQNLLNKQ